MTRFVFRVVPADPARSLPGARRFASRGILMAGRGPRAEAIAAKLSERTEGGVRLEHDRAAALRALADPAQIDTLGFVLDAAEADERREWALSDEEWARRREIALEGPLELIQAFARDRKAGCVFGVTALGGALGFDNVLQGAPEGGALAGLLAALDGRFDGRHLDVTPSATPRQTADVLLELLDELVPPGPRGLVRGHLTRVIRAPREVSSWAGGTGRLPERWVILCSRGVELALAMFVDAQLTALYGPAVHLVPQSDRAALGTALEEIRTKGTIDGLILATGAPDADRWVHALALTASDPISHALAIVPEPRPLQGAHAATQLAQSAAAGVIARLTATYRAARETVRASALIFSPDRAQIAVAETSVRELLAGLPEAEVHFAAEADPHAARWQELDRRAAASPLLDTVVCYEEARIIAEREMSAAEPYLDHHRIGPTPIMPAVAGLEMMAELAAIAGGRWSLGDVEIAHTLKIRERGSQAVRVTLEGDTLRITATARRPDGVVLEPERVHLTARRIAPAPLPSRELPRWEGEPSPFPYPRQIDRTRGSRLMYHGPVFRCLDGVLPREGGGLARLVVPAVEALVPGSKPDAWVLPAALVDGCLQAAGLLGRILFSISALPVAFGRIDVSPRAVHATGERVTVDVRVAKNGISEIAADILAVGEDGPLVSIQGYRARAMRGL